MSGFFNRTNAIRVRKIGEYIELIEKSAASNRAGPEAVKTILAPVISKIDEISGTETREAPTSGLPPAPAVIPEPHPHAPRRGGTNPHRWTSVLDMCREADTRDLVWALSVIGERLQEELGYPWEGGE